MRGVKYLGNVKFFVSKRVDFANIVHEGEQLLAIIAHHFPEFGFVFDIAEFRREQFVSDNPAVSLLELWGYEVRVRIFFGALKAFRLPGRDVGMAVHVGSAVS